MHSTYTAISPHYEDLFINIEDYFEKSNLSLHKARNEIKVVEYKGQKLIVKSFKIPNIINRVSYSYFRDSKAKKSYYNSLKLQSFAPTAIGYIEYKKFGLLNKSYFISDYFNYNFTIREPLLDKSFENRVELLCAFARFSFEMHERGIFHNDYSPGNILIQKDKSQDYIFKIVDVNRMNFFTLRPEDRAKNFSKLWADDEDLKTILSEYKKHYKTEVDIEQLALKFSHQHKKIKNFKKRLKGKKVDA